MKSTGIVRKIDQLGRIVVPKELRRVLSIDENDPMEIFVENEYVILKKYSALACALCGKSEDLSKFKNKHICSDCAKELHSNIS